MSAAPNTLRPAAALIGSPGRTRRYWAVVVPKCPHCSGLHTHRAGGSPLLREESVRVCPETGVGYLLVPVPMAVQREASERVAASVDAPTMHMRSAS